MDHNRAVSSESEFLQWLTAALDEARDRMHKESAVISTGGDGDPASRDTITQAQKPEEMHPLAHFRSWQARLQLANPRATVMHGKKERP